LALIMLIPQAGRADTAAVSEDQVKAAYLYNFVKFIEWPRESFASDSAPLRICVLGRESVSSILHDITKGKMLNGRSIQVENPAQVSQASPCQVVFITGDNRDSRGTLERLRGLSIVTVGEHDRFLEAGGVINFAIEHERVRFEINAGVARRARLKISAQLLSVAKSVKGE